jgi:hypothetical protein
MAVRLLLHSSLFLLGEIHLLTQRVPALIDEAELRGDLFAGTLLRVGQSVAVWLAADNPERALRNINEAIGRWSQSGYYIQHALGALGSVRVFLYAGLGARAHQVLSEAWPELDRHYILETQYLRIEAHALRAMSCLAAAKEGKPKTDRGGLFKQVERNLSALKDEDPRWAVPLVDLISGALAAHRKNPAAARKNLERAVEGFRAASMRMFEQAARLRLGELIGGPGGQQLVLAAITAMEDQGIRNPRRFANALAPLLP